MRKIDELLNEHAFFKGLSQEYLDLIAGCGRNVRFDTNQTIFRVDDPANEFFIIRHGQVTLELPLPGRGNISIYTLEDNDVMGWSWIVEPYTWHLNARASRLTRAIALDAECLRGKCEEDHDLGYELLKRFSAIMVDRLNNARIQATDIYG